MSVSLKPSFSTDVPQERRGLLEIRVDQDVTVRRGDQVRVQRPRSRHSGCFQSSCGEETPPCPGSDLPAAVRVPATATRRDRRRAINARDYRGSNHVQTPDCGRGPGARRYSSPRVLSSRLIVCARWLRTSDSGLLASKTSTHRSPSPEPGAARLGAPEGAARGWHLRVMDAFCQGADTGACATDLSRANRWIPAESRRSARRTRMRETGQTLWAVMLMVVFALPGGPNPASTTKLDPVLQLRVGQLLGQSKVVVTARDAASLGGVAQVIRLHRRDIGSAPPDHQRAGRPPCQTSGCCCWPAALPWRTWRSIG